MLAYGQEVAPFRPDLVVLLIGTGAIRPALPIPERADYPLRSLIERTAVWDYLQRRVFMDAEAAVLAAAPELEGLAAIEHDPYGEASTAMWSRAKEHLATLHKAVRRDGGKLAVMFFPRLDELLGDAWYQVSRGDPSGQHWKRLLEAAPKALYIDLRRPLRRRIHPLVKRASEQGLIPKQMWGHRRTPEGEAIASDPDSPYLHTDPLHLTASGHRLLAAELVVGLERRAWIQRVESKVR